MPTKTEVRREFFEYLFGNDQGYVCIATATARKNTTFKQEFFRWPVDKLKLLQFIEKNSTNRNVWFCVNLLSKQERKKEFCLPTNLVWADLDDCDPSAVDPPPQCVLESSPNRFQAIWRLDKKLDPVVAEDYSRRIAHLYSKNGADPTGWDLTQLLRVPLTSNFKYQLEGKVPQVKLVRSLEVLAPEGLFASLKPTDVYVSPAEDLDVPKPDELPDHEAVIYKYWNNLKRTAFSQLYEIEPDPNDDWSKLMWRLINICLESGMDAKETFAVVIQARCNKYERDKRPISYLWKEVLKAEQGQKRLTLIVSNQFKPLLLPQIANTEEPPSSFIEDYKEWADEATDAVTEYHELSAFILLSAFCSGNLQLKTSYGDMVPNLWGLVLGDSTLTRKTTAMRMAMDLMTELDQEMLLATDGSAEGLLTGLAGRPNRVSVFYKDEVSGFIDSINRRDYLAGMPETLTNLYDVPPVFRRRLRKDTITISSPVFIFFGGGIRDKVYSLLTDEYILSGFLPRFLIVSGEADTAKIRPTGPATPVSNEKRDQLRERLANLYETYRKMTPITVLGQQTEINSITTVELEDKAWDRYGKIELDMVKAASESPVPMLALPTFERLSRSLLKMSCLLAAARSEPEDNKVTVEVGDVDAAAWYIQRWGRHTVDIVQNSGRTSSQRVLDKILKAIEKNPGISRSALMKHYHLYKREADEIISTLEDRGEIRTIKEGKGVTMYAN